MLNTCKRIGPALVSASFLGMTGCASNEPAPTQDSFALAESSIQRAEEAGAYEHGGAELRSARDKLTQAREAAQEDEPAVAARLADEAQLDAELAMAMLQNAEAQAAVQELRDSIQTLRDEVERGSEVDRGSQQSQPARQSL